MKRVFLAIVATAVLAIPAAFGAKMVCSDTGKEVKSCCCSIKDGKFVCKMTSKAHDKCCCESKS